MKKSSFSKHSQTDKAFLLNAKDKDIDFSDIPEISEEQLSRAVMRNKRGSLGYHGVNPISGLGVEASAGSRGTCSG
ncbi:hypothetical protein MNBD_CHLOROFLEXI01-2777 [hydrothermal vent metagenome]|uniref:Uncharacterized protein n=1 Tax=hydrothermal vent metagenome TaxID=652676 RepID=A0A3B0WII9_9ZZZZ